MLRDDRRELVLMLLFCSGVIAAMVAMMLWLSARSAAVLTHDIKEKLRTYAVLSAAQFAAEDIGKIKDEKERESPLFHSLVARAGEIVSAVPDIAYAYVMRKTDDPKVLAFVVENDMLFTPAEQDRNKNGRVEPDEEIPVPGDPFALSDAPAMAQAFFGSLTDPDFTHDQWGWWMSGYAPIRDAKGNAVGIIGLDMRSDDFVASTRRIFSPTTIILMGLGGSVIIMGFLLFFWRRRLHLLERIESQRRAMVTVALHKLGGPIATVRWWVDLLDSSTPLAGKGTQEARQELAIAVDRLSEVIKHLDEATRIDGRDPNFHQQLANDTATEISAMTVKNPRRT